jgi:hypothetical protein
VLKLLLLGLWLGVLCVTECGLLLLVWIGFVRCGFLLLFFAMLLLVGFIASISVGELLKEVAHLRAGLTYAGSKQKLITLRGRSILLGLY